MHAALPRPFAWPPATSMADLPPASRPREKLLARGAAALADVELLALLLRTGRPGTPVLQFAQRVLDGCGGLAGLLHADPAALAAVDGLGPARRAALAAVIELARRAAQHRLAERPVFDAPLQVKEYARLQLAHLDHEVFALMFLDTRHRLLCWEHMFRGTLAQTSVYPREVVKRALELGAAALILLHNHPSGDAEPSRADQHLTATLQAALALVDVRVLDHLVVGRADTVSFAERGLL